MEFIPINLHLQRMHVHSPRLKGKAYSAEKSSEYEKAYFEIQLNLQLREAVLILALYKMQVS